PRAAGGRQRGHTRVPAAAAAARLRGHHRDRRAGSAGGRPTGPAGHPSQRRDDAPPRRPSAGRGVARGPAHGGGPGAAAVRTGWAGGGDRGSGGWRGRLPRQAVLRGRTASPGPGQRGARAAAQPPRPLARGPARLAARGVLRARRGRRRGGNQRRLHQHHGVRLGGAAVLPRAAVVARREGRPRGAPDASRGPQAPDDGQQGQLHRPARPPRRAADLGIGQLQRGQDPGGWPPPGGGDVPRRHGGTLRRAAGGGAGRDGPGGVQGRERRPGPAGDAGRTAAAVAGALRNALAGLRDQPLLTPTAGAPGGAGIRLEHPAGTLGIWIELGSGRVLTAEDRTLLSLVCGYLGQVLHRAYQTDQQRETALALQRAILGPSRLPAGFAVRYEPATRPLEVGGDWYDIVELPDGRIGIVVGDCVGHDLGAATVMGQLRSACRALLLQDASASQALTAMDRFASSVPGAECATVFCGILDPATGSLRYSSAAHPPGIVILPGGRVVLLDGARSLPLAIRQDAARTDADYILPPQSTLLLYTDGLVERRGQPLTEGIAAAGAAVHEAGGDSLEELASQVMTRLAPTEGYEDDVALVLYHHPGPLDVLFSAESEQLASVRATLRGWLRSCDVDARTAQDVLVATGEAIANAIEHGHRDRPDQQVRLRAVSTANQLRLTVTDSGRWQATPPGDRGLRGHGIGLMRALMQH